MAWGNKKSREQEFLRTGQSAALRPGDIGAKEIYDDLDDDAPFLFGIPNEPDDNDADETSP